MSVFKSIFVALLFHLIMQIDILLQIAAYASGNGATFVLVFLTFLFGIAAFYVPFVVFENSDRKIYLGSVAVFAVLYILFICISATEYFTWLFKIAVPSYDKTYYEIDINALVTGVAHTVAYAVSSVLYLKASR